MNHKRKFGIYTAISLMFVGILAYFLIILLGDARTINYTGLIRGGTQKVIVNQLNGVYDQDFIAYLDDIIDSLQTENGLYYSVETHDTYYQAQLLYLDELWGEIKVELAQLEAGAGDAEVLYTLSQLHFQEADDLVSYTESLSAGVLNRFALFFAISLILEGSFLYFIYKKSKQALEDTMSKDWLTGILSRKGFELEAKKLLRRHSNQAFLLVKFDIDTFKLINNRYGHDTGDRFLCALANALEVLLGDSGICSRHNADNFLLLTPASDSFLDQLAVALSCASHSFAFTSEDVQFIYGIYAPKDNSEPVPAMVEKVILAHKYLKDNRGKSLIWYDDKLLTSLEQNQYYVEHMQQGMEEGEFKMYLQPQMNLETHAVSQAESLVRWQLPDGRLLYPDSFIPLFEQKGLIARLDFYMLSQACRFLQDLRQEQGRAFTIAVNFSRATLSRPDFCQSFLDVVADFDLPHPCIEIEVTETSLNQVSAAAIAQLVRLREAGFLLAMDDFGAGYSSLSSLSQLPVHTIKLDRQFLWAMDSCDNMKEIIQSTVDMSHKIGVQVTCEGVETQEHLTFIQQAGCDFAQGYFFAKPMPVEDFCQAYLS